MAANRITKKLAVATLFVALVALLPAWGQNGPGIIPRGNKQQPVGGIGWSPVVRGGFMSSRTSPIVTIEGARAGIDTDGSSWQVIFWITNVSGGDSSPLDFVFLDSNGKYFETNLTTAGLITMSDFSEGSGYLSSFASQRSILTANYGNAPAELFSITLHSNGGLALSAIQEHIGADGYLAEPPTALVSRPKNFSLAGTGFAFPLDYEGGIDETLIFSNPSSEPASATLQLYGGDGLQAPGRTPFATIAFSVPPGTSSQLLSDLVASNSDFASFTARDGGYIAQGFIGLTIDRPVWFESTFDILDVQAEKSDRVSWQIFTVPASSAQ